MFSIHSFVISILLYLSFSASFLFSQIRGEDEVSVPDSVSAGIESKADTLKEKRTSKSPSGGAVYLFKVTDIYNSSNIEKKEAGITDDIIVKVDSLGIMVGRTTEETGPIILFINHLPLKGVYGVPNLVNNEMRYTLSRNEQANLTWDILLSKPSFNATKKPVLISIGFEKGQELPVKDNNFTLVIIKPVTLVVSVLILLLLLVILIWLGKNTEMLREPFSIAENGKNRPYSLALTQMAFWYYLIVSSIIFLFLITKEFPEINSSILILIGISSLTALSSTAINSSRIYDTKEKAINLNAEKKTLSERIQEINNILKSQKNLAPDKIMEMNKDKMDSEKRLNEVIETLPTYRFDNSNYFCKGFFKDMVSDSTGVSLHRFQIAVWTLVLSIFFVYSVWSTLKMPDFNETLLALMGISSGTYIGFKIPEQKM
jgi:hypothetical protein